MQIELTNGCFEKMEEMSGMECHLAVSKDINNRAVSTGGLEVTPLLIMEMKMNDGGLAGVETLHLCLPCGSTCSPSCAVNQLCQRDWPGLDSVRLVHFSRGNLDKYKQPVFFTLSLGLFYSFPFCTLPRGDWMTTSTVALESGLDRFLVCSISIPFMFLLLQLTCREQNPVS